MAGSYEHLLGVDGGWPMIENMGDAHECVEELWWLVERALGERKAKQLLLSDFYPMKRGEIPKDAAMKKVEYGMNR